MKVLKGLGKKVKATTATAAERVATPEAPQAPGTPPPQTPSTPPQTPPASPETPAPAPTNQQIRAKVMRGCRQVGDTMEYTVGDETLTIKRTAADHYEIVDKSGTVISTASDTNGVADFIEGRAATHAATPLAPEAPKATQANPPLQLTYQPNLQNLLAAIERDRAHAVELKAQYEKATGEAKAALEDELKAADRQVIADEAAIAKAQEAPKETPRVRTSEEVKKDINSKHLEIDQIKVDLEQARINKNPSGITHFEEALQTAEADLKRLEEELVISEKAAAEQATKESTAPRNEKLRAKIQSLDTDGKSIDLNISVLGKLKVKRISEHLYEIENEAGVTTKSVTSQDEVAQFLEEKIATAKATKEAGAAKPKDAAETTPPSTSIPSLEELRGLKVGESRKAMIGDTDSRHIQYEITRVSETDFTIKNIDMCQETVTVRGEEGVVKFFKEKIDATKPAPEKPATPPRTPEQLQALITQERAEITRLEQKLAEAKANKDSSAQNEFETKLKIAKSSLAQYESELAAVPRAAPTDTPNPRIAELRASLDTDRARLAEIDGILKTEKNKDVRLRLAQEKGTINRRIKTSEDELKGLEGTPAEATETATSIRERVAKIAERMKTGLKGMTDRLRKTESTPPAERTAAIRSELKKM